MKLVILVDNNPRDGFYTAWGLSILIESGRKVLFDAGPDPRILTENAKRLGVDLSSIDFAFLSHPHADHYGGFLGDLPFRGKRIFVPLSTPEPLVRELSNRGMEVIRTTPFSEAFPGMRAIGELIGPPPEQSLLVEESGRFFLLTGCSHPGIVKIVRKALEYAPQLDLVIGGFHLAWSGKGTIEEVGRSIIQERIGKIAPIHCSGNAIREYLQGIARDRVLLLGVGDVVEI